MLHLALNKNPTLFMSFHEQGQLKLSMFSVHIPQFLTRKVGQFQATATYLWIRALLTLRTAVKKKNTKTYLTIKVLFSPSDTRTKQHFGGEVSLSCTTTYILSSALAKKQ